ncbi:endonuclease/exonuclease/phosphatase family protein [Psychroserpens sp.]|uniref:endonuclease/exonuclease/phosphatase family protein n=1 Tax=Psychroserpens sp. TaxID=2020870 RepID=UPI003C7099E7
MEKIRKILIGILYTVAVLVALFSILSIFRNTPSRYLKMLDFPRIQFFITSLICLVILIVLTKHRKWYNYVMMSLLLLGLLINGNYLYSYTPFSSVTVPNSPPSINTDKVISILLVNVKMKNRNSKKLLEQIETKNPDVILAMEVDRWWDKQLSKIEKKYPYHREVINDVAYGMALYSKYSFENITVDNLNNDKIPYIEGLLRVKNNRLVTFHCVHPVPPTHYKDLPDNEGNEEKAMKMLGFRVEEANYPSIVIGDFNDVVWSKVDELTHTDNLLFDVRTGRGFYNSYNAESFIMRWPLDHIYVTKEFSLKKIERLDYMGSDHYPMYVELTL